jgi:hypothetical protein
MKVVIDGREVDVVDAPNDLERVSKYVEHYVRVVPPLGMAFRVSDEYLRDETPYFDVSVFERPPITMKSPYNIDYRQYWKRYSVLRWKRESRYAFLREEISVYYRGDEEYVFYDPGVRKIADTAFLFVDDITERDGVEIQTNLYDFIVPFEVFNCWLELEKSCSKVSSRTVARRMPAPLKGYLVLHLNDEYQSIDLIRSMTPDVSDSARLDECFVALDSHTFESVLNVLKRVDATTAFVEILKTAIKHAHEKYDLPSISRLLNH